MLITHRNFYAFKDDKMAAGHSEYTHGTMPVSAQEGTFKGFMAVTMYGGAFTVVSLLFPTLVFGANLGWLPALITSLVVGIVIGMALKLKGAWYASIIGLAAVSGLLCLIFSSLT